MSFLDKIHFGDSPAEVLSLVEGRDVYAIIDKTVDDLYGYAFPFRKILINASEQNKNIDTVNIILERLLEFNAGRDCFLLGIGGGVTTDTVGFAASIYKRGVSYGLVPTTLLSQIDAAIGGKTGINVGGVKNAAGTFGNPEFVYINPAFTETQSRREYISGVYELLKVFIINSSDWYHKSLQQLQGGGKVDSATIKAAIMFKCMIVDEDFLEKGFRRVLNLGHTFGHAIESANHWQTTHGEAVALGIVYAARLGVSLGLTPIELPSKLLDDFKTIGLEIPEKIDFEMVYANVLNDKKRNGDYLEIVIPTSIGCVKTELLKINQLKIF